MYSKGLGLVSRRAYVNACLRRSADRPAELATKSLVVSQLPWINPIATIVY